MKTVVVEGLSARLGGGQTYMRNLFEYYPGYSDLRVVGIVPAPDREFFDCHPDIELLAPELASRNIANRLLWNKLRLPALLGQLDASVLFCPGGFLATRPAPPCRTAVTFQNMLPFSPEERGRYPLGFSRGRLKLLGSVQAASFRDADLVVFISEFARAVIELVVPERRGASVVIPHGLSDHFRTKHPRPDHPRLPEEYVAYVSILTVYKAQLEVLRAWRELRARRPTREKLVLIGPEYPPYGHRVRALVRELGLEQDVVLLGNVPYEQLPAYYQHAKVNVFASSCENCPNVLLEKLAAGRPVVCSDFPPMPEFGGDAVVYFDPYNPSQLADTLVGLLDDEVAQDEWGRRAAERALTYQWPTAARRTWDALRALALGEV